MYVKVVRLKCLTKAANRYEVYVQEQYIIMAFCAVISIAHNYLIRHLLSQDPIIIEQLPIYSNKAIRCTVIEHS